MFLCVFAPIAGLWLQPLAWRPRQRASHAWRWSAPQSLLHSLARKWVPSWLPLRQVPRWTLTSRTHALFVSSVAHGGKWTCGVRSSMSSSISITDVKRRGLLPCLQRRPTAPRAGSQDPRTICISWCAIWASTGWTPWCNFSSLTMACRFSSLTSASSGARWLEHDGISWN